jgi:nucleoside phosphorylase
MRQFFDVGLIIPLREEFESAREILRFEDPDSHFYYPFSIPGSSLRGIATILLDMGQAESAGAATRLLERFDVRLLALVGIAGALDRDLRLGDVVVADAVDEYLHAAKVIPDGKSQGFEFELGSFSWRAGNAIASYVGNFGLLAGGAELAEWRERGRRRLDPGLQAAMPAMVGAVPAYRVGAIATGDVVSAAAPFAHWLRAHNRRLVAIEMEAGGAARALNRQGRTDLIVVRGVSDFADERKSMLDSAATPDTNPRAWRRYAILNAADLFAVLVTNPLFPWSRASNDGPDREDPKAMTSGGGQHAQASGNASIYQANSHSGAIYQAHTINMRPEQAVDHAELGAQALVVHDYSSARAHFADAAKATPTDPLIQYQLSLAELDGQRPHMHSAATIETVERRLKSVIEQLPEIRALQLLVAEDYRLTWKTNNSVPQALIDLVNSVPAQRAREITEHVPAEESRVWRLLAVRAGNRH